MNDTILIIEDNLEMRENTAEMLSLAGYKVLTAKDGKEGVDTAVKQPPDLILCDIMMPGMDGYEVLNTLQSVPKMVGVPFVFLTAKTAKNDFRFGMDLGADDYLTKPFNERDLLKVVDSRIKKSRLLKKRYENNLQGLNDLISEVNTTANMGLLQENRHVKKLRAKDFLFMEGDTADFLYFIISGRIKTYKTNEFGKEYIIEMHKKGDFLGHAALLDGSIGGTKYRLTATAIEDSEVAMIPKQDFYKLIYSNQEVAMKFISFMSNNLHDVEERLVKLAYDSARKRVAEALLFVFRKYQMENKDGASFPIHRENISALAGVSPESVSRNLTDFKNEGLIDIDSRNIRILEYRKLEGLKN